MHAYIHTCMHTYMQTYMHTCMHTCMHTYMQACIHTYIRTYMHAYMHTYIPHIHHIHVMRFPENIQSLSAWSEPRTSSATLEREAVGNGTATTTSPEQPLGQLGRRRLGILQGCLCSLRMHQSLVAKRGRGEEVLGIHVVHALFSRSLVQRRGPKLSREPSLEFTQVQVPEAAWARSSRDPSPKKGACAHRLQFRLVENRTFLNWSLKRSASF